MQRLPFICSAAQEVLFSLLIYPNPLPVVTSLDKAVRKKVSLEMQKGGESHPGLSWSHCWCLSISEALWSLLMTSDRCLKVASSIRIGAPGQHFSGSQRNWARIRGSQARVRSGGNQAWVAKLPLQGEQQQRGP